jgi:hypothetical protein
MEDIKRLATIEVYVSLILSILGIIFLSFYGITTERISNGEAIIVETGQFEPVSVVWLILPLIGLIGIVKERKRMVVVAAFVMLLMTLLALLSIGLYFLPATFMLVIAAVTYGLKKDLSP